MFMSTSGFTYAILLTVGAISAVQAQAPTPSSDPAAASSAHQRDVTGKGADEAAADGQSDPGAASSPHQRAAVATPSGAGSMSSNGGGTDPATFVKNAALGGLTEVTLSRAAAAKSQDPKIRKFANQMIQDHSKANDELTSLARQKGWEVPAALDAKHQAVVQKLSHQTGTGFDQAYSKQMMADHEKTVALFQDATRSSDPDLAAFAKKTLPTLQQHEQMADQLPGAMRSASSDGATSQTK
jgi:putative membrane protein